MTVTAVGFSGPTFIQTPGNGAATVYTFPFLVSAAGDVIVGFVVSGVYTLQPTVTYTVAGVGNTGGGTVTFTIAPPFGTIVDIRSQIPETQPTNFANLGGYYPESTTNAVDRVTRLVTDLYRLTYQFGIHASDNENVPWTALPGPSIRAGNALMFDPITGLPTLGVPNTQVITTGLLAPFLGLSQTAAEASAGITPTNLASPPLIGLMPQRFGAVGDGVNDDTPALQNWLLVLGQNTQKAFGYWPAGIYKHTANLTVPASVNILGAGSQLTILKPTASVTTALTTSSGCKLHAFKIDGTNTTNATGLLIAPVGPDYNEIQDVWVQNFLGSGATNGIGIIVQNSVSLYCLRMFALSCNINMLVLGSPAGSLPTTSVFESCQFNTAINNAGAAVSGVGVWMRSGQQCTFRDTIFEVNAAQGLFVQAIAGGIVQDLTVEDCWFEDNYHGYVGVPQVYSLQVDGTTGSGANVSLIGLHMTQGAILSARKSILLASCLASFRRCRASYYGFADDIVVTGGGAALVYVVDDAYDRCGRFIDSSAAVGSVYYPPYLPIITLPGLNSVLPTIEKLVALTYSASMTPDMQFGNSFNIQVNNTSAFTINSPLNTAYVQIGKRHGVRINNVSGNNTLGAVTWGALYKTAFATGASAPANNFSLYLEFEWDGAHMVECYRSPANVPV